MVFKVANWLMIAAFLFSVAVQYNDPDPIRWMLVYGLAALACILKLRGRLSWYFPAAVGCGGVRLGGLDCAARHRQNHVWRYVSVIRHDQLRGGRGPRNGRASDCGGLDGCAGACHKAWQNRRDAEALRTRKRTVEVPALVRCNKLRHSCRGISLERLARAIQTAGAAWSSTLAVLK